MFFGRVRVAIGLVAVSTGLTAGAALALNLGDAGGISYRAVDDHAQAGHTADARARCPRGKSPTGGGFQTSALRGYDEFQSAGSKPFDGPDSNRRPDDGWEVRGNTAEHAFNATATAICAKGAKRYLSDQAKIDGVKAVRVMCPTAKFHVTGGGGVLGKSASSILIASFPVDGKDGDKLPDDGWEAWGQSGHADTLRVYAVCARTSIPLYAETTLSLDPGTGTRGTAKCGTGRHLLGVGGRVGTAPSTTARVQLAQPSDFDLDGTYDDAGATFGETDVSAPGPEDSTTYAVCTH